MTDSRVARLFDCLVELLLFLFELLLDSLGFVQWLSDRIAQVLGFAGIVVCTAAADQQQASGNRRYFHRFKLRRRAETLSSRSTAVVVTYRPGSLPRSRRELSHQCSALPSFSTGDAVFCCERETHCNRHEPAVPWPPGRRPRPDERIRAVRRFDAGEPETPRARARALHERATLEPRRTRSWRGTGARRAWNRVPDGFKPLLDAAHAYQQGAKRRYQRLTPGHDFDRATGCAATIGCQVLCAGGSACGQAQYASRAPGWRRACAARQRAGTASRYCEKSGDSEAPSMGWIPDGAWRAPEPPRSVCPDSQLAKIDG